VSDTEDAGLVSLGLLIGREAVRLLPVQGGVDNVSVFGEARETDTPDNG
jgi:hypothetical protein